MLVILLIYPIYYQWTCTGDITDISNILPMDSNVRRWSKYELNIHKNSIVIESYFEVEQLNVKTKMLLSTTNIKKYSNLEFSSLF